MREGEPKTASPDILGTKHFLLYPSLLTMLIPPPSTHQSTWSAMYALSHPPYPASYEIIHPFVHLTHSPHAHPFICISLHPLTHPSSYLCVRTLTHLPSSHPAVHLSTDLTFCVPTHPAPLSITSNGGDVTELGNWYLFSALPQSLLKVFHRCSFIFASNV